MERKSFLDQEAPAGYVAGVGRGATGFTTSADATSIQDTSSGRQISQNIDHDDQDSGDNVSSDMEPDAGETDGVEKGLLTSSSRSKDDEEADKIYDEVDRRMLTRNKRKVDEIRHEDTDNLKLQFSDLKQGLAKVSEQEWALIPEPGDLTRKNKRARIIERQNRRYYAVPDNILDRAGSISAINDSTTDFDSISIARDQLLSKHLDSLMPTTSKESTDNHDDLIEVETDIDNKIADIKKSRQIFASLRKTEPNKANSWIASARLEEEAKNFNMARNLVLQGCRRVPHSENMWLESIRIHQKSADTSLRLRQLISDALRLNPTSETLWIKAFDIENESDSFSRRRVLMKAIEQLPSSKALWKRLISLDDDQKTMIKLLEKAVLLITDDWELWQSLINLSGYEDAKLVLNRARKALNNYYKVWITATKLEERGNESASDSKLIELMAKGLEAIRGNETDNKELNSRMFLIEAAEAEREGFTKSCKAIVFSIMAERENYADLNTDDSNLLINWAFEEANFFSKNFSFQTANFIYQYIIENYSSSIESWIYLFDSLKKTEKDHSILYEFYQKAIDANPEVEVLPLMYAKDKWRLDNDVDGARNILALAGKRIPESEEIWFARVKLEYKNGLFVNAKEISSQAIDHIASPSARVWLKHIHLLRFIQSRLADQLSNYKSEILSLSDDAIEKFPTCAKLYLQKGQILLQDLNLPEQARDIFSRGVVNCPGSVELWASLSTIEVSVFKVAIKARSILDKALLENPKSDIIWTKKIELEQNLGNLNAAMLLSNKAVKVLPDSSLLWVQHMTLITKASERRNSFVDALKYTNNSALVLLQIAIFFWQDNKYMKARSWLERAKSNTNNNGDIWGWLNYILESKGTADEVKSLQDDYLKHFDDINTGLAWNSINKAPSNLDKSPRELLEAVTQKIAN